MPQASPLYWFLIFLSIIIMTSIFIIKINFFKMFYPKKSMKKFFTPSIYWKF